MFTLNVRHLAERMLFAGYAKQQHAKRNSNDALAEEKSHNELAQLSAWGAVRKTKARWQDPTIGRLVRRFEHEGEDE